MPRDDTSAKATQSGISFALLRPPRSELNSIREARLAQRNTQSTLAADWQVCQLMTTPKKRKPRPSRGRGIRSTSGCKTCRARRLKCGEERPICANCIKSTRECTYDTDSSSLLGAANNDTAVPKLASTAIRDPALDDEESQTQSESQDDANSIPHEFSVRHQALEDATQSAASDQVRHFDSAIAPSPADAALSPATTTSFTAGAAPYHWYDLIARDAWKNADQYDFLTSHGSRWSFNSSDIPSIPRSIQHPSPSLSSPPIQRWPSNDAGRANLSHHSAAEPAFRARHDNASNNGQALDCDESSILQPWNTAQDITLTQREVEYLYHYVEVVSPLLDLFDPQQHFQIHVVRLAMRNEGILKSVLAVAALHKSFYTSQDPGILSVSNLVSTPTEQSAQSDKQIAAQYYYETISWLSQAMQLPGYAHSPEILANAALISWYEAFESDTSMNWERHLKGVFWIQRSQNTDGESKGLRKAVWWSWLRQDIWAAIRHGRRTLTIHQPSKMASELDRDDLACRILFILAKAVSYASPEAQHTLELEQRLAEGQELLAMLREWHGLLPDDFRPLTMTVKASAPSRYPPVWIHPPMFAAAMQAFHSAKILILINMPSPGGRQAYQERQRLLDECVCYICGIAEAPNFLYPPLALLNSQALFIGTSISESLTDNSLIACPIC